MLTLWVLRDTVHFSPAWAFPVSITAKCDAFGFYVCDLGGQNLPLRYTLASEKLIIWKSPVWTFASKLSHLFLFLPLLGGAGETRREVCLKRLHLQQVPGFRLGCLKKKTSPKSLTFWWKNTTFCFSVFKMREAASVPHANFAEIAQVLSCF